MGALLRRRPNCFNLLHQLEFLERSGMTQSMTLQSLEAGHSHIMLFPFHRPHPASASKAHGSIAAFAAAYSLGEKESGAAVNLLTKVPPVIKEGLTILVRFPIFTLRGFDFSRNNHYVNAGKNQLLIYEKMLLMHLLSWCVFSTACSLKAVHDGSFHQPWWHSWWNAQHWL